MLSLKQKKSRINDLHKITEQIISELYPIPKVITYFSYHSDDLENLTLEFISEANKIRFSIIFDLEPIAAYYYIIDGCKTEYGFANKEIIISKFKSLFLV